MSLPSRYTLLEIITRALPYLEFLHDEEIKGPEGMCSDGGALRALIEDAKKATEDK